ncbi:nucleotidyltransferase family protein [Methylobacterium sp. Leaf108]|uniref:nucleotidyltransferase family protein n=1 Tax=Methylobacterium sp. Leaf108 TaxID=1736256 RepID=UPI000700048D|nr:nucleotidyltransferase family protein [Methylobacterium sp. Leaf108]KQP61797.1 4-diphosphocytidyl-2C-methyl-D-erythritol kinase [Methylobacterium sp. Leaf108]
MPETIAILLLAAGRGSRFGEAPKLLALLEGKPLVRHAAEAALASGLGPVTVVLGTHGPRIRAALDGLDLACLTNPAPQDGLASSLRLGLAAVPAGTGGIIVMLADMPRIRPDHLAALAAAYAAGEPRPAAVVPIHGGRRGNPVLLDRARLGQDIARLSGDRGAGRLLAGRGDVVEIAMDAAVRYDVDTPDALDRA